MFKFKGLNLRSIYSVLMHTFVSPAVIINLRLVIYCTYREIEREGFIGYKEVY